MNVHMVTRYCTSVKELGPLWAHFAFEFESINGWINHLFHRTYNPDKQVHIGITWYIVDNFYRLSKVC